MSQMSAKDRAFEQERISYRHQIRTLHETINQQAEEEYKLKKQVAELSDKIRQQDDWIRRLLDYMDNEPGGLPEIMQAEKIFSRFKILMQGLGIRV